MNRLILMKTQQTVEIRAQGLAPLRKWAVGLMLLLLVSMLYIPAVIGQGDTAVPTLVPPTLVPTQDAGVTDALLAESAVARIKRESSLRVGMLYNAPPFGELNIRGEVSGFDADLGRSLADAWGVTFEPVQVTRQTALDMLNTGQVDLLIASQIHQREMDSFVEFSHTYYRGSQSMLLRNDDGAASLGDMAGRRVGVVLASPAERAVNSWQRRTGISVTVQTYLTLDQAFVALVNSEVDGVVDSRGRLGRIDVAPGVVRMLDEGVEPEPYAIAMRRQDVNMRSLVNKTLQYLVTNGRLSEIYKAHFPGSDYPPGLIPVWSGLAEEAPKPAEFGDNVPYPAQYVIPRIRANGVVRVAGLAALPEDAPESDRRLDALNRGIIDTMVGRWGLRAEYLPDSAANAVDLVASGQADMAVGISPDWLLASRVDLTGTYLLHGDRLMVEVNSPVEAFTDLRGRWVAIYASEPGAADRVNALADSIGTAVRIFTITREQDAGFNILVEDNADAVYGDILKLLPQLEANPGLLRITTRNDQGDPWYSRRYAAFAVPLNDLDFRLLVDYTLQEIAQDGTLNTLLSRVMLPEDIPTFDIWPGPGDYLGFVLRG